MTNTTTDTDTQEGTALAEITFANYTSDNQSFGPLVLTPTFLKANQPFTLDWTDLNTGSADSGAFVDTFTITSDADGSEVYRKDFAAPSLAPQAQHAQRASHDGLSAGDYQLIVTLNSDASVQERNYSDNQTSWGIKVEAATDSSNNSNDTTSTSDNSTGETNEGSNASQSFSTQTYDVPIVAQPSNSTCWATVATMMESWNQQASLTIESVMDQAGTTYRSMFDSNKALPGAQKDAFLASLNLKAEPPMDYSVDGLRGLVEQYGPLWVTTDEAPDGFFAVHARIVTGMQGDGTIDGTLLDVNDPAGGKQYTESFNDFMRKFDKVATDDIATGGNLRVQVVHF